MSTYESNPAGLGVGQRYGARTVGGVNGSFVHNDSQRQVVYDLSAKEPMVGVPMTAGLDGGYLVESIYVEVEAAFAASSTANLSINGGAGLSTAISLSSATPLASRVLTGLANLSGVNDVNIVLTGNAAAIASSTGKARVVVQYKAV